MQNDLKRPPDEPPAAGGCLVGEHGLGQSDAPDSLVIVLELEASTP